MCELHLNKTAVKKKPKTENKAKLGLCLKRGMRERILVGQSSEEGIGGLLGFYTSRDNNNHNLTIIIISSSFEHFLQSIHGM